MNALGEKVMKAKMIFVAAVLFAGTAQAELGSKAPLKADFHNMIVNTYQERATLATEVSEDAAAQQEKNLAEQNDSKRVTDFVDVEIGWGEAPRTVDRRFDSIGQARIEPNF